MSKKLTQRQSQILEFISNSIENSGMPPTRAEIAKHLGFRSANAAEDHLRALARKKVIELRPGYSRGIRLLKPVGLPVIGEVSAGDPILATEHIEGRYQLSSSLFNPSADFLLRVRGMSMQGVGILNHDLLAVHKTHEANNGHIVVARIEDDVTVKQFRRRGNIITLLPKNPEFEPIRIDLRKQECIIDGIGVGVLRNGKIP